MNKQREVGYYWCTFDNEFWVTGFWDGFCWEVCGHACSPCDIRVDENRILDPDEQKELKDKIIGEICSEKGFTKDEAELHEVIANGLRGEQ